MKNKIFSGLFVIIVGIGFISCEKEIRPTISGSETITPSAKRKPYIYYAEWDEWGRASQDCGSWGLCNFRDCWFCDVPGGIHSGKVIFDNKTRKGHLFIELDLSEQIQRDAIQEKSPFFVDFNIKNKNSILHSGEYPFDPSIGTYGGYKVNITVK